MLTIKQQFKDLEEEKKSWSAWRLEKIRRIEENQYRQMISGLTGRASDSESEVSWFESTEINQI